MANKAVFLDRDRTLIEDPGYLSAPEAVKLLPGVDLALKSLAGAGFKIVVVTNQSGIARGLLTEETLEKIHGELRRQLAAGGAHVDAIHYCPFHPEGTVEQYAKESELRKPRPGMLLQAAEELDIDLSRSWMVGDSPRDVEAGYRAGCRTIRVRIPDAPPAVGQESDESVQADFSVRNLVEAARLIIRQADAAPAPAAAPAASPRPNGREEDLMHDSEVRREILRYVRHLARAGQHEEFSFLKLAGGISQILALLALLNVFWRLLNEAPAQQTITWALIAVFLQTFALSLFVLHRNR